jgi:hypothetical protein
MRRRGQCIDRVVAAVAALGFVAGAVPAAAQAEGVMRPATLPTAFVNSPYSVQLEVVADGATPQQPSQWILTGKLPDGLTLSSTGLISGTAPVIPQSATFTVAALDATYHPIAQAEYTLVVGTNTSADSALTPIGDQVVGPLGDVQRQLNLAVALVGYASCPVTHPYVLVAQLNTLIYHQPPHVGCP